MRLTADTSFFIRLSESAPKAISIWEDIVEGKNRLVIPTVVIVELKNRFHRKGLHKEADELVSTFEHSTKITILPLTLDLAKKAGKLAFTYSLTPFDSVVLASAIETGYETMLTSDPLFVRPQKEDQIKIERI